MSLILYPKVIVKAQSFKGHKVHTVPNQSMTLKEILKRFVKREALPQMKEGIYEDRFPYDLEKLSNEDRVVQEEILVDIRERVAGMRADLDKQEKSALEKAKAEKKAEYDKILADVKRQTDPVDTIPKQP